MTGWPAAVDQLGTELEAAIARRERRRRRFWLPRFVPPVALALLVVSAVAIGTTGVIREGVPVPWAGSGKPATRPLPLEPISARDPAGGPPWGIRLATTGPVVCQTVGQIIGGRIGVVRGRLFHALPPAAHDNCARVAARAAVVRWSQYPGANVGSRGSRTVVHGVAGRNVIRVEVLDRALSRTLALSPRRAFVTAYTGLHSPRELKVRITRADGTQAVYGSRR